MSVADVRMIADAIEEQRKREAKEKISLVFELADLIGNRVALTFDTKGKTKRIEPWHLHPGLFEQDQKIDEDERRQIEALKVRASRHAWAEARNRRLMEKNNVDSAHTTD